jgi:hypothetical protein
MKMYINSDVNECVSESLMQPGVRTMVFAFKELKKQAYDAV